MTLREEYMFVWDWLHSEKCRDFFAWLTLSDIGANGNCSYRHPRAEGCLTYPEKISRVFIDRMFGLDGSPALAKNIFNGTWTWEDVFSTIDLPPVRFGYDHDMSYGLACQGAFWDKGEFAIESYFGGMDGNCFTETYVDSGGETHVPRCFDTTRHMLEDAFPTKRPAPSPETPPDEPEPPDENGGEDELPEEEDEEEEEKKPELPKAVDRAIDQADETSPEPPPEEPELVPEFVAAVVDILGAY